MERREGVHRAIKSLQRVDECVQVRHVNCLCGALASTSTAPPRTRAAASPASMWHPRCLRRAGRSGGLVQTKPTSAPVQRKPRGQLALLSSLSGSKGRLATTTVDNSASFGANLSLMGMAECKLHGPKHSGVRSSQSIHQLPAPIAPTTTQQWHAQQGYSPCPPPPTPRFWLRAKAASPRRGGRGSRDWWPRQSAGALGPRQTTVFLQPPDCLQPCPP